MGHQFDPCNPLDTLFTEQARHDDTDWIAMNEGQLRSIHLVNNQRRRLERLREWNRVVVAIDCAKHDLSHICSRTSVVDEMS